MKINTILLSATLLLSFNSVANATGDTNNMASASSTASTAAAMSSGEVKKWIKKQEKSPSNTANLPISACQP